MHVRVASGPASVVSAAMLGALLCAGVALAAPAAAVDDDSRPDARVTHGPSCRPGGIVVEVTGGTVGYAVTLATTRRPAGEEAAEVAPGAVAVLRTGPVEWGETIDPFLRFTALDGSAPGYVDELPGLDFSRPSAQECAAIAPPTGAAMLPAPGASVSAGTVPAVVISAQEVATVAEGGLHWSLPAAGGALVTGLVVVAVSRRPSGRRPSSRCEDRAGSGSA